MLCVSNASGPIQREVFQPRVQELLDGGQLDVNSVDEDASSPLSWAAGCGNVEIVEKLLAKGDVIVSSNPAVTLNETHYFEELEVHC